MFEFAIILPNLNQSHFLPTALESLKCQRASFGIAIMDGGSQDNFRKVVEKYSDIVTYFRSHRDSGQSAAINEGHHKIQGKYVTWLNADDYYFPYTLEYVQDIFDGHPDVDIIYGDAIHVDPDGKFISYFPPARSFDAHELTYNCFICQPACFMRSEAFDNVGGVNPDLHYTMDWDLWCRLSRAGYKFRYVNRPLAAVRYYPETKTLGGNYKRLRELYRIEKKYGRRWFKRSWLGSYYYGLHFKNKTYLESLFYYAFKGLYETKQHLKKLRNTINDDDLIYGFHRWNSVVKNKCEIHFPWYQEKPWKILRLKLKPYQKLESYRLSVNTMDLQKVSWQGNYLTVELDEYAPNFACITIENLIDENWVLEAFSVS